MMLADDLVRPAGQGSADHEDAKDYLPGDVVSWQLDNGLPHIGMVSKIKVEGTERYGVVHNSGLGARIARRLAVAKHLCFRHIGRQLEERCRDAEY